MTCIAALVHEGEVYMAGDSAVTNESWDIVTRSTPKVFRRGEILMGVTGRSRLADIVEHVFNPPSTAKVPDGDISRYIVSDFVATLRETLRDAGHMTQEDGRDKHDGVILLGIRGRIIRLGSDFFTCETPDDYAAVGCGEDVAMGSLHSTAGRIDDPVERLTLALAAAEHHKASVRRPFTILGPDDRKDREADRNGVLAVNLNSLRAQLNR